MDLHQLRQFIALAEERHFGRAAARLNIVQPALTQAIQRLEAHLGAQLLTRDAGGVRLTRAGAVLLEEARRTLSQAAFAEKSVRRVVLGEVGEISIGYVEAALFKAIPPAIRQLNAQRPDVSVKLAPHTTPEQLALIAGGRLDMGLIQFLQRPETDLTVKVVDRVDIRLAAPSNWEIAKRDTVPMSALSALPFLMFRKEAAPDFHAAVFQLCGRNGFAPNVRHEARGLYTFLSLVASGLGVAFLPYGVSPSQVEGVKWLSIEDAQAEELRLSIGVAWVPRALPPEIERLIEIFDQLPHGAPLGENG